MSLDVEKGRITAVIGPNGAGKSTLFNLITGHLQPDSGEVMLEGRDITGIPPHKICGMGIARSFQRTNIFPKLTVFENIQAAFIAHGGKGYDMWGVSERQFRDETEADDRAPGAAGHRRIRSPARSATARRSRWSSASRWPASRACCCSTSRPPA